MSLENTFKSDLVKKIEARWPDAYVLRLDPTYYRSIPDILVLNGPFWGVLEGKRFHDSPTQPNQPYHVGRMDDMSFARFIYPDNTEEVLREMEQSFWLK